MPKSKPPPIEPPPPHKILDVTLPGRTPFASVSPSTCNVLLHPDDASLAESVRRDLEANAAGRTINVGVAGA